MEKLGLGIWAYGTGSDRYVGDGYKPYIPFEERVKRAGKVKGLQGVEICYPYDVNQENIEEVQALLADNGLRPICLIVEVVCDGEWATGSFASPDEAVRMKAIRLTKEAMDVAAELGVETVNLWLGQDGFDYSFEIDYVAAWQRLIEGIRACALYRRDVKIAIEYKVSEPKMKCMVNSGAKVLALAQATGQANVGAVLDVGHALNADESPAEIASILLTSGRLFHLHLNDNYRIADDDMMFGSVRLLQSLELFYWLKKLGYQGWYSLDLYPYRLDATKACNVSIEFMEGIDAVADELLANDAFWGMEAADKIAWIHRRLFWGKGDPS